MVISSINKNKWLKDESTNLGESRLNGLAKNPILGQKRLAKCFAIKSFCLVISTFSLKKLFNFLINHLFL